MQNIEQIHLDHNNITDASSIHIVKGIARHKNVKSFFYTRNEIGPRFIAEL
jgi:hypothetical protein